MRLVRTLVYFCFCLIVTTQALAYERETHADMSQAALQSSVLNQPSSKVLTDLGLEQSINVVRQFPDSSGVESSITQLFRTGARFEDNFPRPRHHFYDPINNRPLTIGGTAVGRTSPDWALEDNGQITGVFGIGAQEFSFSDARGYLLKALTQPTKAERDRNFGLTFQTIGQVIHHIQDMAQPQHVRNDPHLDQGSLLGLNPLFNPSLYEKYTDRDAVRNALPFSGYAPTYSPADSTTFNTGWNFWHTPEGKGLADFTNRNFVSAGTNFDKPGLFPSPVRDESKTIDMDIQQLCTNANPPCLNPNLTGVITFYGNTVEDRLTGQAVNNPFASSLSIFDADLQKTTGTPLSQPRLFTLNQFNFALAHGFLIPRAVAYSTGLINYFFRGKLDAEPQGPGTLLVKNLSTEAMQGDFALYYDDAQGSRHPVTITACQVGSVDVPLDQGKCKGAVLASMNIDVNARLTVSFGAPVSPAPKSPDEYMLVFSGDMGEEKADKDKGMVGAVVGKKISNPYNGALYIAGLDAQNRIVTFKVDPEGMRILNGPGPDGQVRFTSNFWSSPSQKDIDPLFPIIQDFGGAVLSKLNRMKQVVFQSIGSGFTHQTVGLALAKKNGLPMSYAFNTADGRLEFKGFSFIWTARSPDPTIGEFEFRTNLIQADGINGALFYTRRYRDAAQNFITSNGAITLPTFPGVAFRDESGGYVSYNGLRSGNVLISPDGTKVSGFKIVTQDSNFESFFDTYELSVTLGAQPTASLRKVESIKLRDSTPGPNNINESTTIGPIGTPPDLHGESHIKVVDNLMGVLRSGRTFVDYINNKLVSWREEENIEIVRESSTDIITDIVSEPKNGCPQTITSDTRNTSVSTRKDLRARKVLLEEGTVEFTVRNIPRTITGLPGVILCNNCTQTSHLQRVVTVPCAGQQTVTESNDKTLVFHPDAQDPNPTFNGFTVTRALTGRVDGAIVLDWVQSFMGINPPHTPMNFIGGQLIGNKGFIADASPLGEVFVANADKSVVIYRPLSSSGMPATIDIPANVVKLIAALWL